MTLEDIRIQIINNDKSNSFTRQHIFSLVQFKEYADNEFNVAQNMKFVFQREENIVGK